ncbi:hypothetical protein ACVWXL_004641 [Bradyrhizobium sp. GM22.5]
MAKHFRKAIAVEDVVAEHQSDGVLADELSANDKSISQSARTFLMRVGEAKSDLRAVTKQPLKQGLVLRCRDDEDVPDTGEHQGR